MIFEGLCSNDTKTFKLNENNVLPSDCKSMGEAPKITKQQEQTGRLGTKPKQTGKVKAKQRGKWVKWVVWAEQPQKQFIICEFPFPKS